MSNKLDKQLVAGVAMAWTNAYSVAQAAAFLRKMRKEQGITQHEFAELIGVSHATLSALENGRGVSTETFAKALSYLGFRLAVIPKTASVTVVEKSEDLCGGNLYER
ncbi:MAG: helix-turn-helix transcriptional regulator [Raoultibacter sp.]